uniref:Small ribosomal subunit protein uS8c n=1 Tax=Derbesia sp. WEST4838 TaxID=1847751 RepID=A0A1C9JBD3_9CHLO|nr:ribosomal protein S8 [Derbesia sp. WEST4838]AOP19155.1 ribosomal protein S8 [Derbesia sp. WEST4838]
MDIISQTLTSIRNANYCKNQFVCIPPLFINKQLASILKTEGFIESFKNIDNKLILYLKYKGHDQIPILTNLQRISTPGRRVYINSKEIPQLFGGLGIFILSTSKGIMTNKQAQKIKLGGELICSIW